MRKVAFHIQKGGCGKTTLAGNVGYSAALRGARIVLVDADPQGNASSWFLRDTPEWELADVLQGRCTVDQALVQVKDRFWLLPTFGLDGTLKSYSESRLNDEPFIFEDLCETLAESFDLAIFDLSPGMSRLEKCVLLAQDEAVTPLTPEYFSVDGVAIFDNELAKINRGYKRRVRHRAIVCNGVNRSFTRHHAYVEALQLLNGYDLYTVPQDANLPDAQSVHRSVFDYNPHARSIPEIQRIEGDLWP